MVKIAYTNLTDVDILATSISLEIQQPNFEKATLKKQYQVNPFYPKLERYDLMKKNVIKNNDLPIVIPGKSTSGVVYLGEWDFDYPNLVNSLPLTATFKILLEDGSFRNINIDFTKSDEISEIAYSSNGVMHWAPAIEKHLEEIDKEESKNEEIPF